MDTKVFKFIQNFRDTSSDYTHGSLMYPNLGKFKIPSDKMDDFWEIYCSQLQTNQRQFMCGITERSRDVLPILCDIDIKIGYDEDLHNDGNDLQHFYSEHHVKKIVHIYQDILKYILQDYTNCDLTCFVLEKTKPYIKGSVIKNGFHLHFPYIFMDKKEIEVHLTSRVIKRVEEEAVFADINIEHSGELIDKCCTRNPWLLYGSRKDMSLEPFLLSKIYDHNLREIDLEHAVRNLKIYDSDEDEIKIQDVPGDNVKNHQYYLPVYLSIHPRCRKQFFTKSNIDCIVKQQYIKAKESKIVYENKSTEEQIKEAVELMNIISPKRANSYQEWWEIGSILYNIGNGCIEAFELWNTFSRMTDEGNYSESSCVYYWNKFTLSNKGLGSLKYLAQADNPNLYNEWKKQKDKDNLRETLSGGHYDLAKHLYDEYKDQFICASVEKDLWYQFRDHRWHKVEKGLTLRSKISTELVLKVKDLAKLTYDEVKGDDKDSEIVQKKRRDQMDKLIISLKTATFKDNIMKECKELFYKEEFLEKLDQNIYLLGFTDGVLDISTMEFRRGRPEDYISKSTKYDFSRESGDRKYGALKYMYNEDSAEIIEVKNIIFKIFPDPDLREYFIEYCAKLLKGGNFAKNFVVMSGEGDNGKSVTIELLEHVLGEYAIKFPTTLIVGKRTQSSAAAPEVVRSKGIRFAVLQEPSGKDVINDGILKELTGNDSMIARDLFKGSEQMSEIKLFFKLCLICNKLPKIVSDDQAIWNRVRVLNFESKFPKSDADVPATEEEQIQKKIFKREPTLNERLPYLKNAFLWIMIDRWNKIQKYGPMPDPVKVLEATDQYRNKNDFFLQFINENIIEDHDYSTHNGINIKDAYEIFREWYRENFPNQSTPPKADLKEYLHKVWGNPRNNRWPQYRGRKLSDDVKDGKKIVLTEEDFENEEETNCKKLL